MLYDFHTHTFLSDGVLSPIELIRRASVVGYTVLGIADHCGAGTMERVIAEVRRDADLAARYWGFQVLAGVELTHVPAASIAELAAAARELGADHVVVHGETPVEPVEPGTNLAAASCPHVDVLAHPGLLSAEAAQAAAATGVFIEVTGKDGHSLGNGHVVRTAQAAGARLVVNSDTHLPSHLLTPEIARRVARCAGLAEAELQQVLIDHPQELVARAFARR
jgi:putative hydrolase